MKLVDRYSQLLASVPVGEFYASDGQVLPFKGELLHDMQINTGSPYVRFKIYVNEIYVTSVEADVDGVVNLHVKLFKGRNDIKLVNTIVAGDI